jgi:hypothetical protein
MLSAFSVENYRAFSRPQHIEIRPLTLFFGWNSGGKSALIRFLPLIAESLHVAGTPIWLAGEVGRRATWPELVSKTTERSILKFKLHWSESDQYVAEWEVDGDLEGRWQETKSLQITTASAVQTFSRQDEVTELLWTGLIPTGGNLLESRKKEVSILEEKLALLKSQVQWISGVRIPPPRVATYGGGAPPTLCADGKDAVDHLIAARIRSTADPLLEATQSFFSPLGEQLTLDNPTNGTWRIMLQPTGSPKVHVNLCDTGEGYAQVLPVLVALARARSGGPRLLCLEQPELHLHTRAQAELSKVLVETAKDPAKPCILVETHSEVLLRSVQLAIAKGDILPAMVRVYWVESHADGTSDAVAVDFDEQGRPTNTALIAAFDEAVQIGQELWPMQMPKASL